MQLAISNKFIIILELLNVVDVYVDIESFKKQEKQRQPLWVFSSVGLERYLDRVEVSGSNPLTPTTPPTILGAFFIPLCEP